MPCAKTKSIFDTLGVSLLFYFECQVSYNSVLELKAQHLSFSYTEWSCCAFRVKIKKIKHFQYVSRNILEIINTGKIK